VLKAIAFLEVHGVVHRDVKPSNIFVSLEGEVPSPAAAISLLLSSKDARGRKFQAKLGDFGIACLASTTGQDPMVLIGTPRFASANQMMGLELTSEDDLEALVYTQAWLRDPENGLPWRNSQDNFSIVALKSMHISKMRESAKTLEKVLHPFNT